MVRRGGRRVRRASLAFVGALLALLALGLAWLSRPAVPSSERAADAVPALPEAGESTDGAAGRGGSPDDARTDADAREPRGNGSAGSDVGQLLEGVALPQGVVLDAVPTVTRRAGSVEQVAVDLLASYRDAHDCVLASSGYLDLFGSVWGCVVHGGDWVDVCVVSMSGDEGLCEVRVMRLERDEALESLEPEEPSR